MGPKILGMHRILQVASTFRKKVPFNPRNCIRGTTVVHYDFELSPVESSLCFKQTQARQKANLPGIN